VTLASLISSDFRSFFSSLWRALFFIRVFLPRNQIACLGALTG
jgi:hypothetical protein